MHACSSSSPNESPLSSDTRVVGTQAQLLLVRKQEVCNVKVGRPVEASRVYMSKRIR